LNRPTRRAALGAALLGLCVAATIAWPVLGWAQRRQVTAYEPNSPYDGRWTFVRIRYTPAGVGGFRRDVKWDHDYPAGERHFAKIISELSTMQVRTLQTNILTLDDPELFKFPIAYLCEAGYWLPSDAEVKGLREYLLKGGFIIFDDFARNDWLNFSTQMQRVFPELHPMRLTTDDKIFDAFYRIKSLEYNHPYYYGVKAEFWGIYENNDRSQRLLAIINYNNDVSEYWEWSDEGLFPLDASNEAYKLGVNYLIYALTR
jgi:hypothetical protein